MVALRYKAHQCNRSSIVPARWDTDSIGHGIASAEPVLSALNRLRAAMTLPDWVTEDPELHLLPHIRRIVEADGSPWVLTRSSVEDATLVVCLQWRGEGNARLRMDAIALAASFAEPTTFIRQEQRDADLVFEVVTGMLDGDGEFAAHGHLVRFVIARPS
jgi:hypothetical protein